MSPIDLAILAAACALGAAVGGGFMESRIMVERERARCAAIARRKCQQAGQHALGEAIAFEVTGRPPNGTTGPPRGSET